MSAYLCNKETFDKIANTLAFYAEYERNHHYGVSQTAQFILNIRVLDKNGAVKLRPKVSEQAAIFARQLYEMNLDAISQRYKRGKEDDYGYTFTYCMPINNMTVLYKSIGCLMYQCSEGNVPETDLYKKMREIENALAHDIVSNSKEYEKAQWG